jgi:hypothetical protein
MASEATTRHMRPGILAEPARFLRASVAHGIEPATDEAAIEREGGNFSAGLIRRASLVSRGEALGHGYWIDDEFVASVADAGQQNAQGVKARFTHPSLSGDGLGSFLGRFSATELADDGRKAMADLHFSKAAHSAPDGDLAAYVMDLAESDPLAFGVSIVFQPDRQAEIDFALAHGAKWAEDELGRYIDYGDFHSPDPENAKHLPHARLKRLHGADVVDEPAANPDGLFQREQSIAKEADAVMAYALGLAEAAPATTAFSIHPDRIKAFADRFLEAHGLEITQKQTTGGAAPGKEPNMGDTTNNQGQGNAGATPETVQQSSAPQTPATPTGQTQAPASGQAFLDAFGDKGGVWFAQGKTMDEARDLFIADLKADNAALKTQVADLEKRLTAANAAAGAAEGASFDGKDGKSAKGKGAALAKALPDGLAKMAENIKLPGQTQE